MNKLIPILLYILICLTDLIFADVHKPINYFQGAQIVQIVGNGNEIWFATNGRGLLRFNKQNETWYQINSSNSGLKQDQLYCVAVCDDYIWAGSSEGLWILNRLNNNWSLKKFSKGGPFGQWVRALYYDNSQKVLWVGRFKFLSRFDLSSKSWQDFDLTIGKDEQSNNIKSLYVDPDQFLWVGTESGLHKIDTKKFSKEYYNSNRGDFWGDGEFASISCIDNISKELWIGLSEFTTNNRPQFNTGGLYVFDKKKSWARYDKKSGLPANGIYSICNVGNFVFVSVYDFIPYNKNEFGMGISIIQKNTKKIYNIKAKDIGFLNDKVFAIYYDNENLWLGTYSGISRIKMHNEFITRVEK